MATNFSTLMAAISSVGDQAYSVTVPEGWMQGRTTYGGLSAALAFAATKRSYDNLPPLRSAQISFVGPAGGEVAISTSLLRQGRSVTFAGADVSGEKGLATRAVFCFGASRETIFDRSFIDMSDAAVPDVPGPDQSEPFFPPGFSGPPFAQHYETRLAKGARPWTGSDQNSHYLWVRHREESVKGDIGLLALADMPPPAMFPMFPTAAPISSMTWQVNFLTEQPISKDGWWLLKTSAENARGGYSSQDMLVWNSDGEAVIAGRQSVAIFI